MRISWKWIGLLIVGVLGYLFFSGKYKDIPILKDVKNPLDGIKKEDKKPVSVNDNGEEIRFTWVAKSRKDAGGPGANFVTGGSYAGLRYSGGRIMHVNPLDGAEYKMDLNDIKVV